MRFRGARDNTWTWIVSVVAVIVAVVAIWYFFFS
jgi:hypothetical protein